MTTEQEVSRQTADWLTSLPKKRGETAAHWLGVDRIVKAHGLKTRRFAACVAKAFPEIGDDDYWIPHVIPDAFEIHLEEREVVAHEVEYTSVLTQEKLDIYADIWFDLDCFDIGFGLVRWTPYGHHSQVFDLQALWYANLQKRIDAEKADDARPRAGGVV